MPPTTLTCIELSHPSSQEVFHPPKTSRSIGGGTVNSIGSIIVNSCSITQLLFASKISTLIIPGGKFSLSSLPIKVTPSLQSTMYGGVPPLIFKSINPSF